MCGEAFDPFPEVSEAVGFNVWDALSVTAITAPMIGIGVSIVAAVVMTQGMSRKLSIISLAAGVGLIGMLAIDMLGPYGAVKYKYRHVETAVAITLCLALALPLVWRVIYYPSHRRWINLPLSLGASVGACALLTISWMVALT